ncbi:MAG: DNA replication/repair protein RecF [Dehalococcoidia bacterium]|nr:DNA replication/repair protein RecF [Dehalococcoidia bacterium]
MQIEHLSLTNYRNYARLELDLAPGLTILRGDNAQGKTNLLESIHVLATSRSPRAGSDRELINWVALQDAVPYARIVARVRRRDTRLQTELTIAMRDGDSGLTKRYRVNGAPKRVVDIIGLIPVVLFSPLDIELVAGAPSQRRRYLDIMNSQIDREYLRSLQLYTRALAQRNALLRQIRDHLARPEQLAFWDDALTEHGTSIVAKRFRAVEQINALAHELHPALTGNQEYLTVRYEANALQQSAMAPATAPPTTAAIAEAFAAALREARPREITQGVSLVGPHRDDLTFQTDGASTTVYGSRGQQRTAALALKLAEAAFIQQEIGAPPILLLDDVTSELDSRRRRQVFQSIRAHQQVLITATDFEDFEPSVIASATVLQVKAGKIERAR